MYDKYSTKVHPYQTTDKNTFGISAILRLSSYVLQNLNLHQDRSENLNFSKYRILTRHASHCINLRI